MPDKINDKAKDIDEARQGVPKYEVKSSKSGKVLTTIKADDSMVRIYEIAALLVLEDDIASDVAEAVCHCMGDRKSADRAAEAKLNARFHLDKG